MKRKKKIKDKERGRIYTEKKQQVPHETAETRSNTVNDAKIHFLIATAKFASDVFDMHLSSVVSLKNVLCFLMLIFLFFIFLN